MYLGIDVGTSSVKALLLDDGDRIVAESSAPLEVRRPRPLWSEPHPDSWWTATRAALGGLRARGSGGLAGLRLRGGGIGTGGFNFDAKLRRQSVDPVDLFHAHIGGMDTLARGLVAAAYLLEEGRLQEAVDARYAGWSGELGRGILEGKLGLADLWRRAIESESAPRPVSGRQEQLENWVRNGIERAGGTR